MKRHYLKKNNFKATEIWKILQMRLHTCDIFRNFRKMYLKIYYLPPVKFLSAPGLVWQAALKKAELKIKIIN